ncbi:MAG: DUF2848 family protein [Nitrososphaerota archaeon]|nr:DUF2848 family protein [Nitrososphaerota archaeon]MDG6923472.1 DUF2848 family protein [Nitrososphaerota archaeon]
MPILRFEIVSDKSDVESLSFDVKKIVCAGYTGRNQVEVKKHVEELKRLGVPPPPSVPARYVLSADLLTTGGKIGVSSKNTSGEVEAVLLLNGEETYVGIGSDHTDREMEKTDVLRSKMICPKPIGKSVWRFDEVEEHWDELVARSFVHVEEKAVTYQSSKLVALLQPDKILDVLGDRDKGTAVYCGTTPLLREPSYSNEFRIELYDPVRKKSLTHEYRVS